MKKNELSKTIREFRDRYFRFFPRKATFLGNHDYDDMLGKWNREGVREKITFLEHYRDLVKDYLEIDALVVRNIIDSHLFHLKSIRPYLRPDFFVEEALDSIDTMIHLLEKTQDRETMARLVNALVSRVNGFPLLFEQARDWLTYNTPTSRNHALRMVAFFKEFLENHYRPYVHSLNLENDFREKLIGVIPFTMESLSRFAHFVRTLEVIPHHHPRLKRPRNFYRDLFGKKYMLDYTPDGLLEVASRRAAELVADMKEISGNDPEGYYESLVKRNSLPYSENGLNDRIMRYFKKTAKKYLEFCRSSRLVPAGEEPLIEWTPLYKRASSPLAAYIARGPYETLKNRGLFWICPAREPLTRKEFEEQRAIYNRQMMNSMIIHELVGHHLQLDRVPRLRREAFKFSGNLSFDEGFALYMEEVFAQEYARELKDEQEASDMLFFQKKAELMRVHRVYVDINLGTGRLSLDEAVRYFAERNALPPDTARIECEKYYLNPGVASSYFVGKLEIMKLRDELERKFKDRFSLSLFHRGLINYGSIPIPLIKRAMVEKLFKAENVII
ncbi:MAG: DUF885 family protein [Deltaproteobacteria bacterium]|nr:DUF885 family protein [Deltaproteobacteria bacterium]MBW2347886.1 DUF885 family protein [Deltaproteobacteria bacterium]RLB37141.1 MAG: hypothetical protein DRH20_08355 [Deltaproteobacteria bacterium]